MDTITEKKQGKAETEDFMPIMGTDYVEIYTSNARQAAYFYQSAFGFHPVAHCGLETGMKDRETYVVQQDKIRLVLTSPLKGGTEIGKHIDAHGDGVRVIALWVDDAVYAYKTAVERGAESYMKPVVESDEHGKVIRSGIKIYGDTVHIFVERKDYEGVFLPGFEPWDSGMEIKPIGLK